MRHSLILMAIAGALTFTAVPAAMAANAATKVSEAQNHDWITLRGTVKSTDAQQFTLGYKGGDIRIEMDGRGSFTPSALKAGDRVVVTGRLDKDFYEQKKIEASSVYVPRLSEYFYASPRDEENGYYSYSLSMMNWDDDDWLTITGRVQSIDGKDMVVSTGTRSFAVDTDGMTNSPVGNLVDVGDRVLVSGQIDDADLFDGREIEAHTVTILTNNNT